MKSLRMLAAKDVFKLADGNHPNVMFQTCPVKIAKTLAHSAEEAAWKQRHESHYRGYKKSRAPAPIARHRAPEE